MNVPSLQFLAAVFLLSATVICLPSVRLRQAVLALCNAGFLYLLIPNTASGFALGIFLLSGYGMARMLIKWPSYLVLSAYLIILIAVFLVIKRYEFITFYLPDVITAYELKIVGLSYILFRQIHFLVDAIQGQIETPSLWSFANYQLNLFALLSGPIQRYQDFHDQWNQLSSKPKHSFEVQAIYFRLLVGVVKMAVIATAFFALYQRSALALGQEASQLPRGIAIEHFFGILYFYPLYLYLNFSGYCDVVIAGAVLIGIRLPENFDQPYLARNVIDYWTRWHRTLGFWIRDYLFTPLYKAVAENWPERADSLAFLCYFIAFFVVGIWHGPTANFVIYGLFQAVGVSAAKLWERHIVKRRGRVGLKQYLQSYRVRIAAIVATLHFECISLLFFPTDVHTTVQMLRTVWRSLR